MTSLAIFVSGLLFGLGLVISGLINPAKVMGFLDIAGPWDPSLAVTMGVAVVVTTLGYRLALTRTQPVCAETFQLPAAKAIDARLLGGAAIFGIGWGLAGFCPGPAVAASAMGYQPAIVFSLAMILGMAVARQLNTANVVSLAGPRTVSDNMGESK